MHERTIHQYCTFRLNARLFGVDICDVREINRQTSFTAIPHAPAGVVGHINVRGQVFLIFDVGLMFGFPAKAVSDKSRLVLFKPSVAELLGILVDEVGDIVETDAPIEQQNEGPDHPLNYSSGAVRTDVVNGVCQLPNDLLVILDAGRLIKLIEPAEEAA